MAKKTASLFATTQASLRVSSMLEDDDMRLALAEAASKHELPEARRFNVHTELLASQLGKKQKAIDNREFFSTRHMSEAIILLAGRPVLFIKNSIFADPDLPELAKRLKPFKAKLQKSIEAVGRIELLDHDTFSWVGTGWRIEEDLVITNRHVALEFAERRGGRYASRLNRRNKPVRAQVDFREEYQQPAVNELFVKDIVWIAEDSSEAPDMAILKVDKNAALPSPIELYDKSLKHKQFIAVVGYPAKDHRNDPGAMADVFGDIFEVKRFAPGEIASIPDHAWYFLHDASTLGGNSGSVILDIDSQKALGLHFGGQFRQANYAVSAKTIKSILTQRPWVYFSSSSIGFPETQQELVRQKNDLADRTGYNPNFLSIKVALPKPGKRHIVVKLDNGESELRYTHFSVVMNKTRRLPIITAVNIDGSQKRRVQRTNPWGYDPRISRDAQVGNNFYGPAEFDRGHMVRRDDPIWGTPEEALKGHTDSFCFTNACPQVPNLNQVSWLSLEDYVLDNAVTEGFRATVFTGPVLNDQLDVSYEGDQISVMVPIQFWKVAIVIDSDTAELASAGYLLSQEGMMPAEGFRYGTFKTYQVPITKIKQMADINFSANVLASDVLGDEKLEEKVFMGSRYLEIRGSEDIVLRKK